MPRQETKPSRIGLISLLLGTAALFCLGLEAFARVGVEQRSKVQRDVNRQYAGAVNIRAGKRRQLLIVGNSLVGHGLDFDEVQRDLPPAWEAHQFWIYNTAYEDWLYGLQRLLAEGSRPQVIAVDMAAMHWTSSGFRGDYSAQYLFRARDVLAVGWDLNLDRTAEAGLLLAHYSKFYALRSEIRKQVLQSALPALPGMYNLLEPGAHSSLAENKLTELMAQRMAVFRDIAARHGARLFVVVPPIPRPGAEQHSALWAAAARAHVAAFIPMSCSDLPRDDFVDDMHMNQDGSRRFTAKLMAEVAPALAALPQ